MKCVVVGGAGAVGGMLAGLLSAAGSEVCVLDLVDPFIAGQRFLRGDVTAPDGTARAELGAADVLVLAVAEAVGVAAVPVLAGVLRADALLVETMSVKTPIAAAIASTGLSAVGLNPMFAPPLELAGRAVAVVEHRGGPRVAGLLALLAERGGRLVTVVAAEHDRLTAAAQVLTHASVLSFGLALAELDVDIDKLSALAPPPHALMLALLARIAAGTPEVYWDIQEANPSAGQARTALGNGVRQLSEIAETGGLTEFACVQGRLRNTLGGELAGYRKLCAEVFGGLTSREERVDHD